MTVATYLGNAIIRVEKVIFFTSNNNERFSQSAYLQTEDCKGNTERTPFQDLDSTKKLEILSKWVDRVTQINRLPRQIETPENANLCNWQRQGRMRLFERYKEAIQAQFDDLAPPQRESLQLQLDARFRAISSLQFEAAPCP